MAMLQHGAKSRANDLLKIRHRHFEPCVFQHPELWLHTTGRKKLDSEADNQVQSLFLSFRSTSRSFIKRSKNLEL